MKRGERLAAEGAGIYLNYSKNRVANQTFALLLLLAEQSGLRERIDAMFSGEKINVSEGCARRAMLQSP
jgi:glucose-6-phosphate isomerase